MILIRNAKLINEGACYKASVLIDGERIAFIADATRNPLSFVKLFFRIITGIITGKNLKIIPAGGLLLLPGMIDDQVHFREPGLTSKGDIHSESRAAVAGGITSFMDMPNTLPQTVTVEALNDKFDRAANESLANYSFFIGATNNNPEELKNEGAKRASAVKVFMGSSTGNMLVDNPYTLEKIFSGPDAIIAVHCESEAIIQANREKYIQQFGEDLDITYHPKIRSREACFASSSKAVELAKKHNTRLHLFHLSTAEETGLLESKSLKEKRITGEVCVHHLWFCDEDYSRLGNRIKWNPAIKTKADRDALRQALIDGKIDVVATDHAPHRWEEKQGSCLKAASGGPMVQHALTAMLELCKQGVFTQELVVEKMAHAPAELFRLKERGFIRKGYYADLVLVDPDQSWTVRKENLLYKCGWSPFEGTTFSHRVVKTFINGTLVYDDGQFNETFRGKELSLARSTRVHRRGSRVTGNNSLSFNYLML
ncbi:MAG: dihydroorotase [Dysgonamonadaceae bacterium]|jgi:dihydroorotase|nr:dihydroorotase [Dysgonamonadaceae bacterium]